MKRGFIVGIGGVTFDAGNLNRIEFTYEAIAQYRTDAEPFNRRMSPVRTMIR